MIKCFLTLIFVSATLLCNAQILTEDGDLNLMEDVEYCIVFLRGKMFSKKLKVAMDYGQNPNALNNFKALKDENGDKLNFKGTADILNFMHRNGWDYLNSMVTTDKGGFGGANDIYQYYFKRRK